MHFLDDIIIDGTTYQFKYAIPHDIVNLCVKSWRVEIVDYNGMFDLAIWTLEGSLTSL